MNANSYWMINKTPKLGILFVFKERNPDLENRTDG